MRAKRFVSKIVICMLLSGSLLVVSSCSKRQESNSIDTRKNVEFIVKMNSGDYWSSVHSGANEAAKEFNVNMNFIAPDSEQDIESQEKLVSDAINKKTDAIVLAANDYNKLSGIVNKAAENKIPVIIVDSGVSTDKIASTISTDNFQAGKLAGQRLVDLTGKKAKLALLSIVEGSESAQKREEGLMNVLTNYPEVNLVAKEYCNSNEVQAETLTKKILLNNNQIDGIVALNSAASLGACRAIEALGLTGKVKLISFDSTILQLQYLEKGVTQAAVVQNPFKMGYLGVKYAAMAARGETVPKEENIELKVIDKYNIYTPDNERFLFPFVK